MRHDKYSNYWTKAEAEALQGKLVNTNAQTQVVITGMYAESETEFVVTDSKGYGYRQSDNNGLYCWLPSKSECP